jgi:hypothetical protein
MRANCSGTPSTLMGDRGGGNGGGHHQGGGGGDGQNNYGKNKSVAHPSNNNSRNMVWQRDLSGGLIQPTYVTTASEKDMRCKEI